MMGELANTARRLLASWDNPPNACNVSIRAKDRNGSIAHVAAVYDAAPNALRAVIRLETERDRLIRIRAVDRGDQTQARTGWVRFGDSGWRRTADNIIIQRHSGEALDVWERRGIRRDDPRHRWWESALEAMEAIDGEVSDG